MSSFCGFCGAKSNDDRAQFCSDCGGKLEHSTEEGSQKSTLLLPAMASQPGVVLSRSFVDLIKQEASIGKEISPEPSVDLSKSFLASISDMAHEDPQLGRDTLREMPPTEASQIPPRDAIVTLPDFLAPNHNLSALEPMTLPIETKFKAPAMKLPKIEPVPGRDTLTDNKAARRAAKQSGVRVNHAKLASPPEEAPDDSEPPSDVPSVLLSTSMEEIILKDLRKEEKPALSPTELFTAGPGIIPKLPFPKLEAPPKSILLAEPSSIVSEGFPDRLARARPLSFFDLSEVGRAAKSQWVQAILILVTGPLLAGLLQALFGSGLEPLQPLFFGFMLCLLFFRLIAEERQALWPSMVPFLTSWAFAQVATGISSRVLRFGGLWQISLSSLLVTAILSASLLLAWFLGPRLRIFTQPIDAILLGIFSGAGFAVGVSPIFASSLDARSFGLLFTEVLCGGFAGYFWGLSFYKAEKKPFVLAAILGVFCLHVALSLLLSFASLGQGFGLGLLFYALTLCFGYLILFGYIIKLKQLERN